MNHQPILNPRNASAPETEPTLPSLPPDQPSNAPAQFSTAGPSSPAFQDHPLAELFPLLEADDLAALAANIRQEGLRTPIVLHEGKILDGRNRWRACQIAGVDPRTEHFPADGDPLAFVLSANLHRRHLTASQRAMIAARLATLPHGGANKKPEDPSALAPSLAQAAQKLSVGAAIVQKARTILQDEALTRAVESGQKSVHAAAQEIKAAQTVPTVLRDETDYEIPEALWPLWRRKAEVETVLAHIGQARQTLQTALENRDILFLPTKLADVLTYLESAHTGTERSILCAVCPKCDGQHVAACPTCRGRGFLNQEAYERCPEIQEAPTP